MRAAIARVFVIVTITNRYILQLTGSAGPERRKESTEWTARNSQPGNGKLC
jgi:hypothetical protein